MFSEKQLKEIQYAAKKIKNQGELAVYKYLVDTSVYSLFSPTQWQIMKYCAEECKRQRSGEMSVYDMVNAWNEAQMTFNGPTKYNVTLDFIEYIGRLVEPIDNAKGFRTIPIGVTDGMGGWIEKANWERVPELLAALLEAYYDNRLGPKDWYTSNISKLIQSAEDEFYLEYENIHPFRDGNGRTGKILYNYLLGTLDNPVMPPNFWGGSNP